MLISMDEYQILLKHFGNKVREYRKLRELTQEQLCEKIDISTQTLSGIENGKNPPSFAALYRIAQTLKINPMYLFCFNTDTNIVIKMS